MRVFVFSFCSILLFVALAKPQTNRMVVKGKPFKSESEIVAKRDVNGRYAAAIKIISDADGFLYQSYNGIIEVDDLPGEDIVYLQPDERVLQIYKTGFEPLKIILSEIGIVLHPREMWVMHLELQSKKQEAVIPVTILTDPKEVNIFIDGQPLTGGPVFQLPQGKHVLKIEKEGYQTLTDSISVDLKHAFFQFKLNPIEEIGVNITSVPSGARVYLDDVYLGVTPLATFFLPGTYRLRLIKDGFTPLEEQVVIQKPMFKKEYVLEQNVAYLTVKTYPNARLFINDREYAEHENIALTPMVATVRVEVPKAQPMVKRVILKKNQRLVLEMFPELKTGTVKVATTPANAHIELRGDGGEFFQSDQMKIFKNIPVGRYQLTVQHANYLPYKENFVLKEGEVLTKKIALQSQPMAAKAGTKKEEKFSNKVENTHHLPKAYWQYYFTNTDYDFHAPYFWPFNPAGQNRSSLVGVKLSTIQYKFDYQYDRSFTDFTDRFVFTNDYKITDLKLWAFWVGKRWHAGLMLSANEKTLDLEIKRTRLSSLDVSEYLRDYTDKANVASFEVGYRLFSSLQIAGRFNFVTKKHTWVAAENPDDNTANYDYSNGNFDLGVEKQFKKSVQIGVYFSELGNKTSYRDGFGQNEIEGPTYLTTYFNWFVKHYLITMHFRANVKDFQRENTQSIYHLTYSDKQSNFSIGLFRQLGKLNVFGRITARDFTSTYRTIKMDDQSEVSAGEFQSKTSAFTIGANWLIHKILINVEYSHVTKDNKSQRILEKLDYSYSYDYPVLTLSLFYTF